MLVHDPYYDLKAVSNSALRHINPEQGGSPEEFKKYWDGTLPSLRTSSLEFGNLVHLAVLEPHLLNYVVDKTNCPDKIRDIVKEVFNNVKPESNPFDLDSEVIKDFPSYYPAIMSACDKYSYGKTWKEETRLNKVLEQGGSYFNMLATAQKEDAFVITAAQEERLNKVLAGINRDEYGQSMMYMVSEEYDPETDSETGVEYLNEQEVTWTDERYSFPLKGKIDRMRIDHVNREFTIIDLKTTGKSLAEFKNSFEQYHYARQMAAYEIAGSKFCSEKFGMAYKPSHRHIILAIETKGSFRAGRFIIKRRTIEAGQKEYNSLLDRLQYHFESGNWVTDYEYAKHGAYYL